jgi:M6 family metalloprotease-like protein
MKNKLIYFGFGLVLCALSILSSCTEDALKPADGEINVRLWDDGSVSAAAKTAIYRPNGNFIDMMHLQHNPTRPLVIIRYEFQNNWRFNPAVTPAMIDDFFFTNRFAIRHYFTTYSDNQFVIRSGGISDVVRLPYDTLYYLNDQVSKLQPRDWTMSGILKEYLLKNANIDWDVLDKDRNGTIDDSEATICFLSSIGGGGAMRPSAHAVTGVAQPGKSPVNFNFSNRFVFFDAAEAGTRIGSELGYNRYTIIHELGHGMFNLPDRYLDKCGSGTTGKYDVMSDNCGYGVGIQAYDRMKLGWVKPRIVETVNYRPDTARHTFRFYNSGDNGNDAIILYNRNKPNEYWILELKGFGNAYDDRTLDRALAIWWVDASEPDNRRVPRMIHADSTSRLPQQHMFHITTVNKTALIDDNLVRTKGINEFALFHKDGTLAFLLKNYRLTPNGCTIEF